MCKYCNNATQDFEHLLITCGVTKPEGDYQTAHACEDTFKKIVRTKSCECVNLLYNDDDNDLLLMIRYVQLDTVQGP